MKDIHGGDIWAAARATGMPPGEVLDFSASINPLGLPPLARKAVIESLGFVHAYPDPSSAQLKGAIASFIGVKPSHVVPGNGSTELIYALPRAFELSTAVVVEPAFSEYKTSLALFGAKTASFVVKERDGFLPDPQRLARVIRKRPGALFIANPANPTGALVDRTTMLWLARECEDAGVLFVVDEAFADFTPEASIADAVPRLKHTVVLRSMTKFFAMAGLRLGYAVASRASVQRLSSIIPPWSINTLAAAAGEAALRDEAYFARTARWFGRERDLLFAGISGLPGLTPYRSAANYIMVALGGKGPTSRVLAGKLRDNGVLIRDLSAFTGLGPRYFRVAVRDRRDNRSLVDAIAGVLGQKPSFPG